MRALKTILIILLALVAILVILGLMGPSEFRVERSAVIKAPVEVVYANVSSLSAMDKWGPWKEMEHNMTSTRSGKPDGQVGAISHWKSDESEGEQELAELVPNTSVKTKLRFISPFAANNEGTFNLVAMGDSTKVTWGMQGTNDFIGKIACTFIDMEKELGPMFEKGLANMKGFAESEAAAAKEKPAHSLEITSTDRTATLYFGERKVVKWSEMEAFMGATYDKAYGLLTASGVEPAGPATGIYLQWDEENQQTDMMAAVPVPASAKSALKGMSLLETPSSKALQHIHHGDPSGTQLVHYAIDERMKADGLTLNTYVLEEYATGPDQDKDTAKWVTNVIYLIK